MVTCFLVLPFKFRTEGECARLAMDSAYSWDGIDGVSSMGAAGTIAVEPGYAVVGDLGRGGCHSLRL